MGERTALLVYACVPFGRLASAKQAAAYVGLHPHLFQSGASQWSRLSKRGNRIARTALYRVALPAVQSNPRLRSFYQRLLSAGKAKKQALCAVAHKLVRICFALVKYQSTYSLNYQPRVISLFWWSACVGRAHPWPQPGTGIWDHVRMSHGNGTQGVCYHVERTPASKLTPRRWKPSFQGRKAPLVRFLTVK